MADPVCHLTSNEARRVWLRAQRLCSDQPFGSGAAATQAAIAHLGYVQIDTINVIERCHHHILYSRIPDYQRAHLAQAQSMDKSVFEYWTHALSYVATCDLRFYRAAMRARTHVSGLWSGAVSEADLRKVLALIRREGPLTIRDIEDDVLVEKHHPWASRKPSKRALQVAFYSGLVTVSARTGMLKTYELTERHFGWPTQPRAATERQIVEYLLDRALRSQGLVSLDSVCYLDAPRKAAVRALIETRVRRKQLLPVRLDDSGRAEYWMQPEALATTAPLDDERVHILSPFDPLIIQRKRLERIFGYTHRFEAYVPKDKRIMGYFALPVLIGDRVVAAIDLKTDRVKRTLLVQKWTWTADGAARRHRRLIEAALHQFQAFQLA
jgi:uncharacterized protein